jgi:type VI secretion system VasD/TssJ family lipoprotein
MKKIVGPLLLVLCCLLIFSCRAKTVPPAPQVDYTYEPNAIHLHFQADPQLNLFQGNPHTLTMCVYQLGDPNSFNQLAQDEEGLYQLLECGRFDASVATTKTLTIHPGQQVAENLDRAQGAQWVAIVAGYFTLQKEHIVRSYKVPILEIKKGWIRRTKTYKPGPLTIKHRLGPQEIQDIKEEK